MSYDITVTPGNPPPTITVQPLSQSPAEGSQVILSVEATGAEPLSYQWQFNGQNIPGETGKNLTLSTVRPASNGNYRAVVTSPYGTAISSNAVVVVFVVDSDGDGLSNYEEQLLGTDPQNRDTDGDGLTDYEEVRVYETSPKVADSDGDGYSDGIEVRMGGDPNKAAVLPPGALIVFPAVDIEFYTLAGVKYQLEISEDLKTWRSQGNILTGNNGRQNHLVRAIQWHSYWRLRVVK